METQLIKWARKPTASLNRSRSSQLSKTQETRGTVHCPYLASTPPISLSSFDGTCVEKLSPMSQHSPNKAIHLNLSSCLDLGWAVPATMKTRRYSLVYALGSWYIATSIQYSPKISSKEQSCHFAHSSPTPNCLTTSKAPSSAKTNPSAPIYSPGWQNMPETGL